MSDIDVVRVNWVKCPKCSYKYYIGAPLLRVEEVPACCPKCKTEFDPRANLVPKLTALQVYDKWL